MGLVERIVRPSFQSHAGSIEAGASAASPDIASNVSIPRWFD